MTELTREVREEYATGYSYGYERAEYDIRNRMSTAHDVIEETRSEVVYAREHASRRARAHALGHARGYRHAVMDDWARWEAQRETRRQERQARAEQEDAYELSDPKHPRHHKVYADLADLD